MSTPGPRPAPVRRRAEARSPLALWHLLSLDAPTVATLWTALIAHVAGVRLSAVTLPAMFLAVWVLYAADRLLDAQPLHHQPTAADLELRHLFHHRHRRSFLLVLSLATVLLAACIPQLAPAVLKPFLILGTLLAGYFVLIHATSGALRLPKEFAVGLFFSAAVFIPTAVRLSPALLLATVPVAFLFATLSCLNCLCIYAWEHVASPSRLAAAPHPLTEAASRHRRLGAGILLAVSLLCAFAGPSKTLAAAVALSAGALLLLDSVRTRLTPLTARAAVDLALTSPALFLLWDLHR